MSHLAAPRELTIAELRPGDITVDGVVLEVSGPRESDGLFEIYHRSVTYVQEGSDGTHRFGRVRPDVLEAIRKAAR